MSLAPEPPAEPRRRSVPIVIVGLLLKIVLIAVTVAVPLLGIWVASSLAVYLDGPLWVAIAVGVLMFPLAPLLWDRWAEARRARKAAERGRERRRVLSGFDRFVLRTLVLNLALLAVILLAWPRQGFTAISTRGDWMLGGSGSAAAQTIRGALFDIAGGLEWLYDSATDNPYDRWADESGDAPEPTGGSGVSGEGTGVSLGDSAHTWPMPETIHPVVRDLPDSATASIDAVAAHIAGRIDDPFERVKALHDFVATWLAYDADALDDLDSLPSQRAADVFAAREAVCAGYARLLVALGERTGDRFVYVTGHSRASGDALDGVGHAWNAVEIAGRWYLIDATWDAGFVSGGRFTRRYGSEYLLTPPAVFGLDHLPDDPRWQLRDAPLSRGEFLRQPALSPRFFAHGMTLVSPKRSQVPTGGSVVVTVDNPRGVHLLAWAAPRDGGERLRCGMPVADARAELRCELPEDGIYQIQLFANRGATGTFASVGYVEVDNDV